MVRPSLKRASGGLRVWNGFRPGASARCDFGSSEKPTPRFCQTMPVRGRTTPEPNSK